MQEPRGGAFRHLISSYLPLSGWSPSNQYPRREAMKIHIVLVSEQVLANLIPILVECPDLVLLDPNPIDSNSLIGSDIDPI